MSATLRVLRIYHSAVVTEWRQRDRELRRLGCDLRLICPHRWDEGGNDVRFDAAGDDFVKPSRTLGRHPYGFVFDPRPLIAELTSRPLDLVDLHEEPASLVALEVRALLRRYQPGVPLVFYGAQNIEKRFPVPFRWIENGSLRRASGAHTCNSDAGRIFERKGLRGEIRTIGLGVDVERFAPGDFRDDGSLRVGYVGRLIPHKGVHVLLDAMAGLEDVVLEICGDGSSRPGLEAQRTHLGLDDRVTFRGYVDHDQLPTTYRRFDVVAIPSLRTERWVEQFGRVAVEAMASGVPVIASDEGSLRDVVGDAGVLVPAGDADAWHKGIDELARDPSRRRDLRDRGIERAQHYAWPAIAASQLDFYRAAVARRG